MAETASSPSAAAMRMRNHRRRRRKGLLYVGFFITQADVANLIAKGYLDPKQRQDSDAIDEAAAGFLGDALADRVWTL